MLHFLQREKGILSLLVALFFVSLLGLRVSASDVVVSSLNVGEVNLQGLTYMEAGEVLEEEYSEAFKQPVVFNLNGDLESLSLAEIGFGIDSNATVKRVQEEVYGEGIFDHFGNRIKSAVFANKVEPVITVDLEVFRSALRKRYPKLEGAKDAIVHVNENLEVSVIPHEHSVVVDFERLADSMREQLEDGNLISEISLETINDFAEYTLGDAQQDAEILRQFLGRVINVQHIHSPELRFDYELEISPKWIAVKQGQISIDEEAISNYLYKNISPDFYVERSDAVIKSLPLEGIWAEVDGLAMDGVSLDLEVSSGNIANAILNRRESADLSFIYEPAEIINESGQDLGELKLIGEGRSGFWGSDWGRRFNIKKGLEEKVNNILLAPGQEYSFNDNLGKVEYSEGWAGAKAIFGGEDLETVPGGGLCQVSTTLYRAALDADLEILERFSHTLYVYYYEEFGNGLDATIYPGFRDLRFKNDSDDHILIQAYSEEEFGFVNIYGTSDKEVNLIGPIYAGRVPEEFREEMVLQWNEIGWVKEVMEKDGELEREFIITRYKTAPRKMYGVE